MKWTNKEDGSPYQSIFRLLMLTDTERQQLLVDWNNTAVAYPGKDLCLHRLIEEQAMRTPDQAALAFEQQRLTYGELNRRANQLAHHLRGLGAGPDVLVGLFVERSLEMMVGLLGILKAGAAYVPIDAAYPQERIAFMLTDANLTLLLTQTGLLASLPTAAAQVVSLDSFDWTGSKTPAQSDVRVRPENLAYVIYTSGSTGRPKGVCIEHRNIVNYVLGVAERFELKPGMNHATVSTIGADLGNTVIFPALVTGGCLHIISKERVENPGMLSDYFNREKIDILKIVPSHLAALQSGRNPEQVMPRRRLILGGEASRLDWIERLRTLSPNCEIYNHYGPTETTVGVLTYHIGPQLPSTQSGTLPLGRPLPNSRIYILDEGGHPVPIGDQGELCIGGYGVARGYLNRQDLTAERFIPDPFSSDPVGRLYRTGDLARYLPDGSIEFCGRIDHQVKIHGYRIELGEIEGVMREQGGLRDALVLASEDESGSKQLVAYVVPKRVNQPLWGSKALHVLPDGSPVAHMNRNETDYIYNEIFILQAYLRHGISINDGDCIVDAGANIGLFTVFASRLAHNLRIISFEPLSAAFACLKANAEAWGTGVKCLPLGLSSENKSAELTFFEGLSLFSGFYADTAKEREVVKNYVFNQESELQNNGQLAAEIGELIDGRLHTRTESVQLRTLSSVITEEGIDRIDLLKINVEKSELDVLLGLSPGDWPKIRQLVIEVDLQENVEPITALLEQHGFEFLVEQDPLLRNTELCYVYAIRPSATGHRLIRQQSANSYVRPLPSVDKEILTPTTLRTYLKDWLPQYMIPSAFVLMEKFPLTSNGKIDRQALPAFSYEKIQTAHDFVRPNTETEKALAAIWTELLKVENIGINDDFFELGGHSLLGVRMFVRIEKIFGKKIPLATLFDAPTIEGLASVLVEKDFSPSWSSLVKIQTGGSKPPLFLIHGAEGNILLYRDLADCLGPDQPIYGLQSQGLDGNKNLYTRIEDMAAHYIKEIQTLQPEGPYYLGGYCMGGVVALEIAEQLHVQGQKVALLAMFETYNIQSNPGAFSFSHNFYRWLQNIKFQCENIFCIEPGERLKFIIQKTKIEKSRAELTFYVWLSKIAHAFKLPFVLNYPHIFVDKVNDQAYFSYIPQPYSNHVTLFRPKKHFLDLQDPQFGWNGLAAGGLEIRELPVCPRGMLVEPFVQKLAGELKECISKVSRNGSK